MTIMNSAIFKSDLGFVVSRESIRQRNERQGSLALAALCVGRFHWREILFVTLCAFFWTAGQCLAQIGEGGDTASLVQLLPEPGAVLTCGLEIPVSAKVWLRGNTSMPIEYTVRLTVNGCSRDPFQATLNQASGTAIVTWYECVTTCMVKTKIVLLVRDGSILRELAVIENEYAVSETACCVAHSIKCKTAAESSGRVLCSACDRCTPSKYDCRLIQLSGLSRRFYPTFSYSCLAGDSSNPFRVRACRQCPRAIFRCQDEPYIICNQTGGLIKRRSNK